MKLKYYIKTEYTPTYEEHSLTSTKPNQTTTLHPLQNEQQSESPWWMVWAEPDCDINHDFKCD